ncbi:hypothetical protein [Sphingomonas sp. PWP1-2]|uniref:hypothetical protein n=1 Tax=Sphingomonas sp. PWP1-2 TaxID=2804558 RepID=UPI003CE7F4C2
MPDSNVSDPRLNELADLLVEALALSDDLQLSAVALRLEQARLLLLNSAMPRATRQSHVI